MSEPELDTAAFDTLVDLAIAEDLAERGDITSRVARLSGVPACYALVARQAGVIAGTALLRRLLGRLASDAVVLESADRTDGAAVQSGDRVAEIQCPPAQMLPAERIVLNFLGRLCGVATLTARYVQQVADTGARILDTRKTIPGWRELDKYAVRCGGGHNHRAGLYDAILVKDNHLAGIAASDLAAAAADMIAAARTLDPPAKFVEFEVDDLDQFRALLTVEGIDVLMLDNFSTDDMRRAVALRSAAGLDRKVTLEASGGVNLQTVRGIAQTGVDWISVGALTHSSPVFDLGLDAI